ncbi:MAG TPA: hypothetical protein VMI31_12960, partial [Fimbriimonadaceae bacterium]|nr:hypothetical protein [Fimbriimonadaceae bacterium]
MGTIREEQGAAPPLDMAAVRRGFERGLAWFLANSESFSPDSKMAALGGLILVDPARIAPARKILEPAESPNPVAFLFGLVEKSPLPLDWSDPDVFRHSPPLAPQSRYDLYAIDGEACRAAQGQAAFSRVEEPVLSWMRRQDLV